MVFIVKFNVLFLNEILLCFFSNNALSFVLVFTKAYVEYQSCDDSQADMKVRKPLLAAITIVCR